MNNQFTEEEQKKLEDCKEDSRFYAFLEEHDKRMLAHIREEVEELKTTCFPAPVGESYGDIWNRALKQVLALLT